MGEEDKAETLVEPLPPPPPPAATEAETEEKPDDSKAIVPVESKCSVLTVFCSSVICYNSHE